MSKKTVTVEFVPQAWINDYAYPVDPEGETTWEVPVDQLVGLKPDDYPSDELRFMDNVPKWVQEWSGPFYITWNTDRVAELKA